MIKKILKKIIFRLLFNFSFMYLCLVNITLKNT
jgi:hypothetical protein